MDPARATSLTGGLLSGRSSDSEYVLNDESQPTQRDGSTDSVNPLEMFNNFEPNLPTVDDIVLESDEPAEEFGLEEGEEEEEAHSVGLDEKPMKSIEQLDLDYEVDELELGVEFASGEDEEDFVVDDELKDDLKSKLKKEKQKSTTSWMFDQQDAIVSKVQEEAEPAEEVNLSERYGADKIIEDLLNATVEICEYEDPETVLRNRLNSEKLLVSIVSGYHELQQQQKKRFLLNRKVVEYYRRKKNLRALTDDTPEVIIQEMRKYRNSIILLDNLKGRQERTNQDLSARIKVLSDKFDGLFKETNSKIEALNEKLRETGLMTFGKKTGQPLSEKLIDNLIRKMIVTRNQISDVRLVLIKAQHRVAVLQEKAKKLEDLGNGLSMFDFEQLRAETQGLGEKIEERNTELGKLRSRCNSDTHILAHIREKQKMLTIKIAVEEDLLYDLKDEQNSCRNYLHDLKIQRDSIRRHYNQISIQNGLLDKPILLHDFDKTSESIDALQNIINKLDEQKTEMFNKLESYNKE